MKKKVRSKGWDKLTIEWKVLIATFLASSVFLFMASLQIVSHARGCKTQQCLMEDITTFTMTSFFLLCLNAAVLAGFLTVFYWRRYQEIKTKHEKRKKQARGKRKAKITEKHLNKTEN